MASIEIYRIEKRNDIISRDLPVYTHTEKINDKELIILTAKMMLDDGSFSYDIGLFYDGYTVNSRITNLGSVHVNDDKYGCYEDDQGHINLGVLV